jgi:hypothetical protein
MPLIHQGAIQGLPPTLELEWVSTHSIKKNSKFGFCIAQGIWLKPNAFINILMPLINQGANQGLSPTHSIKKKFQIWICIAQGIWLKPNAFINILMPLINQGANQGSPPTLDLEWVLTHSSISNPFHKHLIIQSSPASPIQSPQGLLFFPPPHESAQGCACGANHVCRLHPGLYAGIAGLHPFAPLKYVNDPK